MHLSISCHCGMAAQSVVGAIIPKQTGLALCHCRTCRHSSGLLCTSYYLLSEPPVLLGGLRVFGDTTGSKRYFCEKCGCNVFRTRSPPSEKGEGEAEAARETWEVATGTIANERSSPAPVGGDGLAAATQDQEGDWLKYRRHVSVGDTGDGGLSVWLGEVDDVTMKIADDGDPVSPCSQHRAEPSDISCEASGSEDNLNGHCQCGNVRFHITRPTEDISRRPHSPFPDLMIPYLGKSPEELANKDEDVKWWLRPGPGAPADGPPRRYLAGTCACASCRLVSGFEVQTWAFVPRANIIFHLPRGAPSSSLATSSSTSPSPAPQTADLVPCDFDVLSTLGVLSTYASSEGVRREFCGGCGATVFWRGAFRPELVDVSVGLLSGRGARAEDWLDWWRGRVSFAEEVAKGREGVAAARAKGLIQGLERGILGSVSGSG